VPADQVVEFSVLYKQNCAGCHGVDGKLGPAPPLNDALFLALVPDSVLERVITAGRPGTPMPAFARDKGGALTDAQVKALAVGIKPRWGVTGQKIDNAPLYQVSGAGSHDRGAVVFAQACAVCHGDNGRGVPKDHRMVNVINDPVFLALISDQALRRIIITGRPDLGMPDYAGPRPEQPTFHPLMPGQVNDLIALLTSWRQVAKDNSHRNDVRKPEIPDVAESAQRGARK